MKTHCGYVTIIGRPNVGKSTLLNVLLGKKVSITSRKPQTTRHKILGVKTTENTQMIFLDTPGLHQENKQLLNRYLNRSALQALKDVDCILWVVDVLRWDENDDYVAEKLSKVQSPIIVVLNKVDKLKTYDDVLPLVASFAEQLPQMEIVPVSAKNQLNIDRLLTLVKQSLPENPFYFAETAVTDRSDTFVAAELIREKLVRILGDELPYASMVSVDKLQRKKDICHIHATIWVEKEGQKGIVIGQKGQMLKRIGRAARMSLEDYFSMKVFLEVWVKVKSSWSEDERILKRILQ